MASLGQMTDYDSKISAVLQTLSNDPNPDVTTQLMTALLGQLLPMMRKLASDVETVTKEVASVKAQHAALVSDTSSESEVSYDSDDDELYPLVGSR
jgi:hypothetical protein